METLNKCFPGVTQSKVLCVCMLWMCSFKRYFFFKNSDYDLLSVLSVGKCMTVVLKNKNKNTIMLQVKIIAM